MFTYDNTLSPSSQISATTITVEDTVTVMQALSQPTAGTGDAIEVKPAPVVISVPDPALD
jgi:hypothetical protein